MRTMEYAPPKVEHAPSLPAGFAELREKINRLAEKPLEERFANNTEELVRLTSLSDEDIETFTKTGMNPSKEEIENYKQSVMKSRAKTIFESELMQLLVESSLLPKDSANSPENGFEKPFLCTNEECIEKENLVKGVYRGYDGGNLSGDRFQITRQETAKGAVTDTLLVDAQGHGGGAAPLALLTASFLEAAKKDGVENPLIALDTFISSLPLNRSEVSLQMIHIENPKEGETKNLSITQVGGTYALWVEGDKENGWKLTVIAPEELQQSDTVRPLMLDEGSQMGAIGFNTFVKIAKKWAIIPHEQTFSLPKDASIFCSSDGIFDAINPENGKKLIEEFQEIVSRALEKHPGSDRQQVEEGLSREIQQLSEKYTQTDDETFFKIAA